MRPMLILFAVLSWSCSRALTPPVTESARPLSGPIHILAVVPVGASPTMQGDAAARGPAAVTQMLADAAEREPVWSVAAADKVQSVLPSVSASAGPEARAGAIASRVGADAALSATVSTYSEREGTAYGVSRPASVSIRMWVVRAGEQLPEWKADFTFTQEPLAYNLWNFWGVVQGGPRWLTADELARIGVDAAIQRLARRAG
jgi:hypothetical protein